MKTPVRMHRAYALIGMGPICQTLEEGLGIPAGIVAVTDIADIMVESVVTGTQRTSRWAEGISAGWAPAATSSATNCWGSVERMIASPTRTTSAPQRAKLMTS